MFSLFKPSSEKRLELAEAVFDCLKLHTGGIDNKLRQKARIIVEKAKNRQEVLDKVIELCQGIESQKAYYLIGTAYVWKGAKYRKQAITYLEKYLASPVEIKKAFYEREGRMVDGFSSGVQLSYVYSDLAKCYEGDYIFDKALKYYKKALDLDYSVPSTYIHVAKLYVKMNDLDKAIELLEKAKKSKYYKPKKVTMPLDGKTYYDDTFKKVIDNYLEDLKKKKEKGYIYRPRKIKASKEAQK